MYLVETLIEVRYRINRHCAVLQKNEMLTRYALIDPVLRALGWDTEDPEIVVPEYTTPTGRMDYVLLWNNQMYIALEAKALWSGLVSARSTGFQYCWHNQIRFYLISDGDTWELYDMTVLSGKLELKLQINTATHLGHAAYDLLRLHRALMPLYVSAPSATTTGTTSSGSLGSPSASRVTLEDLHQQGYPVTQKRPQQVIFPNSSSAVLSTWKDFLIETIKYLDRIQKLPPPPYSLGKQGKSYLYNTTPTHPSGRQMRSPTEVSTSRGQIYVETHGSASNLCQTVYELVKEAGISPNDVILVLV